jgi:hypothetical protein
MSSYGPETFDRWANIYAQAYAAAIRQGRSAIDAANVAKIAVKEWRALLDEIA